MGYKENKKQIDRDYGLYKDAYDFTYEERERIKADKYKAVILTDIDFILRKKGILVDINDITKLKKITESQEKKFENNITLWKNIRSTPYDGRQKERMGVLFSLDKETIASKPWSTLARIYQTSLSMRQLNDMEEYKELVRGEIGIAVISAKQAKVDKQQDALDVLIAVEGEMSQKPPLTDAEKTALADYIQKDKFFADMNKLPKSVRETLTSITGKLGESRANDAAYIVKCAQEMLGYSPYAMSQKIQLQTMARNSAQRILEIEKEKYKKDLSRKDEIIKEILGKNAVNTRREEVERRIAFNGKNLLDYKDMLKGNHINSKEYKNMTAALQLLVNWNNPEMQSEIRNRKGAPKSFEGALKLVQDTAQAYLDAKNAQTRNNPSALRVSRLAYAQSILDYAKYSKETMDISKEINKDLKLIKEIKETGKLPEEIIKEANKEQEMEMSV